MRRTILAAVFQLLAWAAIIISFEPGFALMMERNFAGRPPSYYADIYFSSNVYRSCLVAVAGIGVGSALFWLGSCIKAKDSVVPRKIGWWGKCKRGVITLFFLFVGVAIVFFIGPGRTDFLRAQTGGGRRASNRYGFHGNIERDIGTGYCTGFPQ